MNNTTKQKKMLLHTCCCPCFSSVFEQIADEFDITSFFCNPNIAPPAEYERRLEELKNYPPSENIHVIEHKPAFIDLPDTPEGGDRCRKCIEFRLDQTARYAKEHDFDIFATTLTVSPHKNADMINEIGSVLSTKYKIEYYSSNFKKKNGFLRSLELSKIYNLYRQDYCGCGI